MWWHKRFLFIILLEKNNTVRCHIFSVKTSGGKFMTNIIQAGIRTFSAVPVVGEAKYALTNRGIDGQTLPHGFIFSSEVKTHYTDQELAKAIPQVVKQIKVNNEEINASFHKSWAKVINSPIQLLVMEQIMHYFTTYGFKNCGMFDSETVYVPIEQLDLPDEETLPIIVINAVDIKSVVERVLNILASGTALSKETSNDIYTLCFAGNVNEDDLEKVKNREVKTRLYSELHLTTVKAEEFLRLVVFTILGTTLVIKNKRTFVGIREALTIKSSLSKKVVKIFKDYEEKYGFVELAKSFNRFKPIYLALRCNSELNKIVNRISKLSKQYHVPVGLDYLASLTEMIARGETISVDELKDNLAKVNIFRKIRLYNALSYRLLDNGSIVYRVRNGRSWASEKKSPVDTKQLEIAKEVVYQAIVEQVKPLVANKTILIQNNVHFAVPTSEKQFMGEIPVGTVFDITNEMVVGIHWNNLENNQIDLDLSLSNFGEKFGWDGHIRDENKEIYFSGDMTDASGALGASELFYIGEVQDNTYILKVNFYNCDYDERFVPYKFFIGHGNSEAMKKENRLLTADQTDFQINDEVNREKTIGLVNIVDGKKQFVMDNTVLSGRISAKHTDAMENFLQTVQGQIGTKLYLNDLLTAAGAKVVNEVVGKETVDIDLSLDKISKTTVLETLI